MADTRFKAKNGLNNNSKTITGVSSGNRTIDLGGDLTTANAFTTSGNYALTLTTTASTNVTLPTTGTLAAGTGATGRMAYWSGTNALTSDANLYWYSSEFHVGTSTSYIGLQYGWSGSTGSWINLSTDGPSGIGSGGAGSNAWVAYAYSGGQWLSDASAGDICYRNTGGRLLFGTASANAGVSIASNKLGIGVTSASVPLHIVSTTEQFRAAYDSNNYLSSTVASNGATTFQLNTNSATLPRFIFKLGANSGAEVGTWRYAATFAVFGNSALDQSLIGNFALAQNTDGITYLNAPSGQYIVLRNSGSIDMLTVNGNGVFGKIIPKINSTVTSNTISPNADADNMISATGIAAGLRINNPSGTPQDGQRLMVRFKDNGSSQTLTWGTVSVTSAYAAGGVALPTATTAGKWMHLGFIYNSTDSNWKLIASAVEA